MSNSAHFTIRLSIVLFIMLAAIGSVTIARAQPAKPAVRASASELLQIQNDITFFESLRGTVSRNQFEVDELGTYLNLSPDEILTFVTTEIAFEQYPGTLRGARGTLMSRAGNSLDQALLLATLLKAAGMEARILRGTLSPEQTMQLLAQMNQTETPAQPPARVGAWNELNSVDTADNASGSAGEPTGASQSADGDLDIALETAQLLETVLARKGARPESLAAVIAQEASDYFWVEYRAQAADPWLDAHPALTGAGFPAASIEAGEVYTDQVPAELQHQFRFEVFVERRELGKLRVHQIVPAWQRPVANMLGRSFYFANFPGDIDKDPLKEDISELIAASKLFVPLFNGEVIDGSTGFDLDGVPYDLDFAGDKAAALFKTVGAKTDRAAAALKGLGSAKPADERARYLTAQWIEYTLIAPGGGTTTSRRYVFDRIGQAARESGAAADIKLEPAQPWQVMASEEFIIAGGVYPDSLVLDENLSRHIGGKKLMQALGTNGEVTLADFRQAESNSNGPGAAVLLSLLQSFDHGLTAVQSAPTYRSAPTVLALHWGQVEVDRARFSTDIIANERRSRAWPHGQAARQDILRQGVWETVAEGQAIQWLDVPGETTETPLALFPNPDELADLVVLTKPEELAEVELTADHRAMLAEALNAGHWVVTRRHGILQPMHWWKVDPGSGTVLGLLSDGRGAAATEYLIALSGVALVMAGALAIHSLVSCTVESVNSQAGAGREARPLDCCMIDQFTPDGSTAETLAYKWAMSTAHFRQQVGMDLDYCMSPPN